MPGSCRTPLKTPSNGGSRDERRCTTRTADRNICPSEWPGPGANPLSAASATHVTIPRPKRPVQSRSHPPPPPLEKLRRPRIHHLEWLGRFNNRRLPDLLNKIPPAEAEADCRAVRETQTIAPQLKSNSRRKPGAVRKLCAVFLEFNGRLHAVVHVQAFPIGQQLSRHCS
jgi:hypothetical protein